MWTDAGIATVTLCYPSVRLQEVAASPLKWDIISSEGEWLNTVAQLFSTNNTKISPEHDKSPACL